MPQESANATVQEDPFGDAATIIRPLLQTDRFEVGVQISVQPASPLA